MSDSYFVMPIQRSRYLLVYLTLVHSVILLMMTLLFATSWLLLPVAAVIVVSFIYYCRRYQWLYAGDAITGIRRDSEGNWYLLAADKTVTTPLALQRCIVLPQWVIMYFASGSRWQTRAITITADSVDPELFRQLRVYLRDPKLFQQ